MFSIVLFFDRTIIVIHTSLTAELHAAWGLSMKHEDVGKFGIPQFMECEDVWLTCKQTLGSPVDKNSRSTSHAC